MKINLDKRIKDIKRKVAVIYLAMKIKETPFYAKLLAVITIAYALSPIDLIPDFIPVLGYIDDLIILPILVIITVKLIPKKIIAECEEEAKSIWSNGKPKRWYFAIPIVLIWLLFLLLLIGVL